MATLSKTRQHEIDAIINDLILRTGLRYPKNTLTEIVKELGIAIKLIDFSKVKGGIKASGAVSWQDGSPTIYINDTYSPARKTFTLAHELGHFFLHPNEDKLRLDVVDYSQESAVQESEANYFAASLLMPKEDLLEVLKVTHDPKLIARYFGVSEEAVIVRLRWLKSNGNN